MEQYINKSALVAEIEKLKAYLQIPNAQLEAIKVCDNIISVINSLEVKEVNGVWHDASEMPKGAGDKEILVQFADSHASVFEIDDWEYLDHQTKWAYLKDLI